MKKAESQTEPPDEMLPEYDFQSGARGKYAQRYATGSNVVVLAPDVADVFVDSDSVNEALRVLANLVRQRAAAPAGRPAPRRRPARRSQRG